MEFKQFCIAHGLMVKDITPGRWMRVPTTDHPRSKNGAYKYMGDIGFVQNHATETEVSIWKPENHYEIKIDPKVVIDMASKEESRRKALQEKAATKAQEMINKAKNDWHPYLEKKGFNKKTGLVLNDLLLIPMRIRDKVVGCQTIDHDGNKKFLYGQVTNYATFIIGKGDPVLCEGYATGLSISVVLQTLKVSKCVAVCFSAQNMLKISQRYPKAVIVADNDASGTGERVAKESGLKYWMSDTVGEDFNDYHQRQGLFKATQSLREILYG